MCVWGWGERGEGVGAAGRFYKRFLSCPVNTQFHSHMEIASAKNTFPIYSSAIPPLYMWSIIVWNFGFIKENFWFVHFHEFCHNATGSNRLGPKVSVINAYTMHMHICDRYWQICYSISKTWITEFNILYRPPGRGWGAGLCSNGFQPANQFQPTKSLPPQPLAPSILSLASLPSPIFIPSYACDNICM